MSYMDQPIISVLRFPSFAPGNWRAKAVDWIRKHKDGIIATVIGGLVVGVILFFLGGIWNKLGDVDTRLGRLETKFAGIEGPIEAISDSLPDLRIRTASETIFGRIEGAALITLPYEQGGKWSRLVYLVGARLGKVDQYQMSLMASDDLSGSLALLGWGRQLDVGLASLREVGQFGIEVGRPQTLPAGIDEEFSFISEANLRPEMGPEIIKNAGLKRLREIDAQPAFSWYEMSLQFLGANWLKARL